MPGNCRDFDIFHNAAQIVPRDADQTIVIRVPDPASVLLRLEQDRQNLPDLLRKIALLAVVGHTLRRVRTRGFYGVAELLGHGIRLRTGTAGIREHVHGRKADPLQECHGLRLIVLCLAGEAVIMSAVSAQPGKYRRSRSTQARNSAVVYLRFMRASVRSQPLCSDR